jgi:ABC-type sugar transport system permease subunit
MRYNSRVPWLFLTPHLSLFLVFVFLPILFIFGLSGFDWNLLGYHRFAGLSNYAEILDDKLFWRALGNTLLFSAVIVPVTMATGLAVAIALNRPMPARNLFRAAMYLPTVISSVASAIVAVWIFDEHYGVLNAFLIQFGLPRLPWLSSTHLALPTIIITTIWLRTGFCMVIYLAALQDVPKSLLDAAALDGAGAWSRFRYITWPLLWPSSIFLLVTNLIYSIHVFDLIYVMTNGGPAFSTTTLVQYLYDAAFEEQRQGYASAISVVLFFVLIALTSVLLIRRNITERQAA